MAPGQGRIEDELSVARARRPDATAIILRERTLTFAELDDASQRVAQRLVALGVTPRDRVAIYLDKCLDKPVALYGIWRAGGIAVPLHGGLVDKQVEHIVTHAGARVVISDKRKLKRRAADATGGAEVITLDVPDEQHDEQHEAQHEEHDGPGLPEALEGGDSPAAILYTSGSTGLPKGILLSHGNLLAGARIVSSYLRLTVDDRLLSVTPFSFDYGLNQLLCACHVGCALVLQRSLLPADIVRTLVEQEVTVLPGVPPLFIQLSLRASPLFVTALPRLRMLTNTGGVFPPELVKRYRETFPHVDVVLMYGLTEAFRSTYLPPSEVDARPWSIGMAIPETDILVLDDEGRPVGPDEAGELVHRGPTVALGYYNDPEATAARFKPDPEAPHAPHRVVYSGDLVRRDADGYLRFVSRRDQMIKTHGFRVSPEEVETALLRSPLVDEVIVHGEPHEVFGAHLVVHVVPAEASLDEEALLTWCRGALPRYQWPGRLVVHARFPRTSSGKVDRKRVRALAEGAT